MPPNIVRHIAQKYGIAYEQYGSAIYLDGFRYRDSNHAFAYLTLAVTGLRLVGGGA